MTEVIAEQNWQWYLLKESKFSPKQLNFKDRAKFAGFIGSNMLDWMIENKYNVKAKPKNTEDLLRMLLHDRIDVILANNFVMDELIKKYKVESKLKSYINKQKPLGVYFSKKFLKDKTNFINEFNGHVKACKLKESY